MSTKPSPSASKMRGEKSESSFRRSLRVDGLPAEVEPKEAEKSEPNRSTLEVSAPSAEVKVSHPSEAEPSAEPEAPPTPEDIVSSLSSPEMKPSGAGQGDEVGAQPSARNDGGRCQVVPAEQKNVAPQDEPEASTTISRLPSANPEPTAANSRSSQVQSGALSLLGSREMQLREQSPAWTGTDPVRLNYTSGSGYFDSTSCGAWSSSLWLDQRQFQRLSDIPEGVEAQHLSLTRPPEMTEIEMIAYGRSQLELWMSLPPGAVVHPIAVAYAPRHEGYNFWEFIRAAGATARHLMSVTQSPAARCLNIFNAERRRIPVVSDLKAVRVSLGLIPPIVCVALLQTILHETGYEFRNQVPAWHTLSEVSSVSESQIRLEVERIGHFIRAELVAWKFAVGSTPYYVRSPSDSLLIASVQTSESRVGFPLDKNGDAIMDEDTQLFLGHEVVVRLQLTGLKPRSPASSLDGEPTRKRPLLIRASTGGSFPSWRNSSDAASETRRDDMSDSVPSMVDAGPNSDPSLMAIGERGNMSYSSSGSSLMSVTDYMLGTGTHLPMPTATVMHGSVTGAIRSSVQGMVMSVTPDPHRTGRVQPRVGAGMYVADQSAQIPLPSSPESNRSAERNVAAAETRPGLGRYHSGVRLETRHISFGDPVAQVDIYDSSSQRDSAQSLLLGLIAMPTRFSGMLLKLDCKPF